MGSAGPHLRRRRDSARGGRRAPGRRSKQAQTHASRAPRNSAPASTSSAWTSSSRTRRATPLATCSRPTSTSPKTASRRRSKPSSSSSSTAAPGRAPTARPRAIRTDYDEETEAARDDVRLFAIFLDDYHVRKGTSLAAREPLARFVERQLGPTDMIGVMYPLESVASVRMTRNHDAVMRGLRQFLGRKFDYTPRNPAGRQVCELPGPDGRRDSQPGLAVGDPLAHRPHGLAQGRAQVADSRERGLQRAAAAAVVRSGRIDARPRQSESGESPTP